MALVLRSEDNIQVCLPFYYVDPYDEIQVTRLSVRALLPARGHLTGDQGYFIF